MLCGPHDYFRAEIIQYGLNRFCGLAWKPNIVTMENVSNSTNNSVSSELLNATILSWGVAYLFRLKIVRDEVIRYKILQLGF